ncbi:MAG TPA: nitrite/sulfite reductase, partial [Micrococcaceae bacterium]
MTQTALAGATSESARTERPARSARPAAKPHGQWKIDGTAPLNANEVWKQEDGGLSCRARIETIYAKQGFDSIDSDDLHGRFRWWGLYTQRRQGIDGGKTATLEPHELEDRYFMLRVRIDGGALTSEQLRVIGGISTDFARDSADLT